LQIRALLQEKKIRKKKSLFERKKIEKKKKRSSASFKIVIIIMGNSCRRGADLDVDPALRAMNRQIEKQLATDRRLLAEEIKLLLLGPGESGKVCKNYGNHTIRRGALNLCLLVSRKRREKEENEN
jgi:hypothetical protein